MKPIVSWLAGAAMVCGLLPGLALANPYMSKAPTHSSSHSSSKKTKKKASTPKPQATASQQPKATKKSEEKGFKPMTLLQNRLQFMAPKSAFKRARGTGVPGAPPPPPDQRENRVILYSRGKKGEMVLMAAEMLVTYTKDFKTKVLKFWKERRMRTFTLRKQKTDGSFQLYFLVPKDIPKGSSLIRGAYVVQADKSLQFVAIYGSPETIQRADQGVPYAEKILRTLRPGTRKLVLRAGTRLLRTFDPNKKLAITVPQGYTVLLQQGPGFYIHRLMKVGKFGQEHPNMLIYIGNKPQLFNKQAPKDKAVIKRQPVRILGRSMQWYRWYIKPNEKGQIIYYMKEVILQLNELSGHNKMHIMFGFEDKKKLLFEPELTRIATSLRIQTVSPQPRR